MGGGWILIAIGTLIALLSMIAVALHFGCGPTAGTPACFDAASKWLYRWQTIITGMLAFIAGLFILIAARWQMAQDDKLARRREAEAWEVVVERLRGIMELADLYFGAVLFSQAAILRGEEPRLDAIIGFPPGNDEALSRMLDFGRFVEELSPEKQWRLQQVLIAVERLQEVAATPIETMPDSRCRERLGAVSRIAREAAAADPRLGEIFEGRPVWPSPYRNIAEVFEPMLPDIDMERRRRRRMARRANVRHPATPA